MCKKKFKVISFDAPNWSDEQGVSNGRFSGLLCPLGCSEEKFECPRGFLRAFRSDCRRKFIKKKFVEEIQRCALVTVFRVLILYWLSFDGTLKFEVFDFQIAKTRDLLICKLWIQNYIWLYNQKFWSWRVHLLETGPLFTS